jgi:hypothetical protein
MAYYSDDVAGVAQQVVRAHANGHSTLTIGTPAQVFDLVTGGWCGRCIRQCYEVAQHQDPGEFQFAAPSAACCEWALKRAGLAVTTPNPGDILCLNDSVPTDRLNDIEWQRAMRNFGHIAIHLGTADNPHELGVGGHFAENTSSPRGPGTVISSYGEIMGRKRTFYRVLPARTGEAPTTPIKIVELPGNLVLAQYNMVSGGNHIADQRKMYVAK